MDLTVVGNVAEAFVWFGLAIALATGTGRAAPVWRRLALITALILVPFGLSDLVETQTGAWWTPWWLLLWKAACVVGLAACLFAYLSQRRAETAKGAAPVKAPPPSDDH